MKFEVGKKVIIIGRKEWLEEPYFYKYWMPLIGKIGVVYSINDKSISVKVCSKIFHFNTNSIKPAEGQLLFNFMYT